MPSTEPPTGKLGAVFASVSRRVRGLARRRSHAILFDREGALVCVDSAPGGQPDVRLRHGAVAAVARARSAGVGVAVVASRSDERVAARVGELVGPVDVWVECPHAPAENCPCKKPAPGLIFLAATALGTRPERCVVIGDVGADVEAASAAGARAILVPSARTSPEDLDAAPVVAASVDDAVAIALGEAA
jgi:HAD superfamily hydrolase (TIGR01662 family)